MKNLLIAITLFSSMQSNALLVDDGSVTGDFCELLVGPGKSSDMFVCFGISTTTSLPLIILDDESIPLDDERMMSLLIDRDVQAMAGMAAHFDVGTDDIEMALGQLDREEKEITFEGISEKLQ